MTAEYDDELYVLLVKRGWSQHDADQIAQGRVPPEASDPSSNPASKEMRDCFQGTIDQYSGQTHYVDCWRDHWPCALARTLDEIDRLTADNKALREVLEEARDLIRECEPGYIPGCGEYKKLRTKMDEFLARAVIKGART